MILLSYIDCSLIELLVRVDPDFLYSLSFSALVFVFLVVNISMLSSNRHGFS